LPDLPRCLAGSSRARKIISGAKDERVAFEQGRSQFYQDPDAYRRSHPRQTAPQQQRRRDGFDLMDIFPTTSCEPFAAPAWRLVELNLRGSANSHRSHA
jgi:hypothetical protein